MLPHHALKLIQTVPYWTLKHFERYNSGRLQAMLLMLLFSQAHTQGRPLSSCLCSGAIPHRAALSDDKPLLR